MTSQGGRKKEQDNKDRKEGQANGRDEDDEDRKERQDDESRDQDQRLNKDVLETSCRWMTYDSGGAGDGAG